jgi:hypothetical protein
MKEEKKTNSSKTNKSKDMYKDIETMLQAMMLDMEEEELPISNDKKLSSKIKEIKEENKESEINFEKFKDNNDLFNYSNDNSNINQKYFMKIFPSLINKNSSQLLQNENDVNKLKKKIIYQSMVNEQNLKTNSDNISLNNCEKFNNNQNVFFNNNAFSIFYNNNINIFINNNLNHSNNNNLNNSSYTKIFKNKPSSNKKVSSSFHLDISLKDLENLLKKENSIDINIFKTIKNDLPYLIKTQNGSKLLQNYLRTTSNQIIHLIFIEIIDKLIILLQEQNSSCFCLKLFCYLDMNDRFNYLNIVTNNIIQLSMNKIATYGIQFIIEKLYSRNEKLMILNPIKMNLYKLALDIYSTHVIEKILMTFEFEYCIEIYNFIIENLIFLSNHVNGLCLVKQTLVLQYKKEFYHIIKKTLIERSFELIENPYGNYALQIIIDYWSHDDIIEIFKQFFGNCTELSILKYSSNVIEKCLMKSEIFLNYFIQETCIEKKSIGILIKNAFGNYVIQTALKSSKGKAKMILINSIENNLGILGEKKLINKWKNIISLNIENNVNNTNNVNNYYIKKNYTYRSDINNNVNKEI